MRDRDELLRRPEPAAVLADLDGVLVDSWAAIERTWRRWADSRALDGNEVMAALATPRTLDVVRQFVADSQSETEAKIIEMWQSTDTEGVTAFPGALELMNAVPKERFAIVTSCSRQLALARLQAAGLHVPAVLVSGDQISAGKPDPEGYLLASARLGVEPHRCLVLEDTPAGIEAGRKAGMTVIALTTTHPQRELVLADECVGSLLELLPVLDGLNRVQ